MYADAALSTADQPAGPVLCYMRVGQLSLPVIIRLAGLGVETHFRDEWLGPLAAPFTVQQRDTGTPTTGLRLEGRKKEKFRSLLYEHLLDPTPRQNCLRHIQTRQLTNQSTSGAASSGGAEGTNSAASEERTCSPLRCALHGPSQHFL